MSTGPVPLTAAGTEVARYHDGTDLEPTLSPRPYLHPVRTPAGVDLTEIWPEDHRHHYGMSAAVVDVNGVSYWGGNSYVAGQGYVLLPNQGRQVGDDPELTDVDGGVRLHQHLSWQSPEGTAQLAEEREIRLLRTATPAHLLTWRSSLRAAHGDLLIGSPATRGRTGAGYGGLFWRLGPEAPTTVRVGTPDGVVTGEEAALGAVGRWLTLTQHRETGPVTLLLAQPAAAVEAHPWFVRTSGYVGAGPAVAWDQLRPLPAGATLDLQLWAALTDTDLDPADAASLVTELEHLAS